MFSVIGMFFAMVPIIVCQFYLTAIWLIAVFVQWLVSKIRKKKFKRYYAGAAAILLTVIYLSVGWYNAHHIVETRYEVTSEKEIPGGKLRIVQITDMHMGATFDGEEFAEYMKEIEKCNPDIVVITGDYVDEGSPKEDMEIGCRAMGEIASTYGTYFIYGNHDKGNYTSSREFSAEDLEKELEKNHITILEDETLLLDDGFYLIGRQDLSEPEREDMSALVEGLDKSKYMLVLDHQPGDYDDQRETKVDLVLSGHTHGGHIFPVRLIDEFFKINCMSYGMKTEGNTTFEVSAGISGWAIPFKTGGAISEYVVIDVIGKK